MKVSVEVNGLDAVKARLRGLSESKIKVAAAAALNDAAWLTVQEEKKQIERVFDRPTPWIRGGVRYVKAKKDRLEAVVDLDFWGNKQGVTVEQVLKAEVYGGQRRHKRHEVALQRAGVLPAGWYIVPGEAADMDAYGNMKAGQIVQIITWFRASGEVGYKANMTQATKEKLWKIKKSAYGLAYFYVAPGARRPRSQRKQNLHPGVYKRINTAFGTAIRPVMIFVQHSNYKPRFDFYGVAEKFAQKEFNRAFPMYLNKLLDERGL